VIVLQVVAAVMLAGFIWVAFAFSDTKQGGGGGYGYGYSDYTRKRRSSEEQDEGIRNWDLILCETKFIKLNSESNHLNNNVSDILGFELPSFESTLRC